jgi:hypothetical protein
MILPFGFGDHARIGQEKSRHRKHRKRKRYCYCGKRALPYPSDLCAVCRDKAKRFNKKVMERKR